MAALYSDLLPVAAERDAKLLSDVKATITEAGARTLQEMRTAVLAKEYDEAALAGEAKL